MVYFWRSILSIVPSFLPPVVLGLLAVRLHEFAGYGSVLTFALPYCAVYAASVYLLAMNESEKGMVKGIARKLIRR